MKHVRDRKDSIGLSIIITAHHEGLLAHKTILSVLDAVAPLEKEGVLVEIIVSVDNPDKVTEDYYHRYRADKRFTIITVSYGNVSESRNNAIALARGKYVALLDGDDLLSPNFYIEAYRMAEERDGLFVLRPNVQLQFGIDTSETGIWLIDNSFEIGKDVRIMAYYNRWPSVALFAPRAVFDTIQFFPSTKGYGYEDYHANAEMLAAGIPQVVVPETTFFYRRSLGGKQNEHITESTVLPYTRLLDFDFVKSTLGNTGEGASKSSSYKLSDTVDKLLQRTVRVGKKVLPIGVKQFVKPIIYKTVMRVQNKKLPEWLLNQWKAVNRIENQLWPTAYSLSNIDYHILNSHQDDAVATQAGDAYVRLAQQFTKKPDYIFFTYDPLGAGGTEKVLVHYIDAIKKAHPNWHIAVFRKKPEHFPFAVPDGVDFIDFFGETKRLNELQQAALLDRLIIQSQAKRLHAFLNGWANSDDTYNWLRRHKKLLKENGYIVNVSWFMREYVIDSEKDRISTFADPYLGEIYDVVNKVFTDNQTVIHQSLENNAFDANKFTAHYQPIDVRELVPPKKINPRETLRVLWAGRLSYQKRPDIVRKIAKKLDAANIQIDVYGRQQHFDGRYFNGIPAVTYKGEFSGISSLPTEAYDVFLYTSQVDGLPNVLLEATAVGLPIVASDDGGVGEFVIDEKTGKLVAIDDIDGYISALEALRKRPDDAMNFVNNAQALLKKRHVLKRFEEAVAEDI